MAEKPQPNDDKLPHTQGGATTRDDVTDVGVPMLAGDPAEPIGPEDAFGPGPKRGDYTQGARSYVMVPVSNPQPGDPTVRAVDQATRAANRGEVARQKGGVTTS